MNTDTMLTNLSELGSVTIGRLVRSERFIVTFTPADGSAPITEFSITTINAALWVIYQRLVNAAVTSIEASITLKDKEVTR